MSPTPNDDYLDRVKAEIRADAELARARHPLPRIEPAPRAVQPLRHDDGVDRERLDYAIGELTAPDYIAFIDHAFRSLLKRAPDDAGAGMQIRILAAGGSKAEVLGNLRWSPEGRRIGTRVGGLLPRYALAKLTRVRFVGYFVEWALTLAALPLLLRHQRAADTSVAARFGEVGDAQQRMRTVLGELGTAHTDLRDEHARRSNALRADVGSLLLRADALEAHARDLDQRSAASAHELQDLRHHVHAVNHWVASVQRSVGDLEQLAADERTRSDTLLATLADDPADAAARGERHAAWSAVLATRLPLDAAVLDLGSGDGRWLLALATRGIASSGIEPNAALVARAQADGARVALGDPMAGLRRCDSASLDGITLARGVLGDDIEHALEHLAECARVLKPGGYLMLRIERDRQRLADFSDPALATDHGAWNSLLAAAGLVAQAPLPAAGGDALLARRGAP